MEKKEELKQLDGIEIEEECVDLLETVFEKGQLLEGQEEQKDPNEAERAIDELGEKGCTMGLIHIVETFSKEGKQPGADVRKKLAGRAADCISRSRRKEQKP